MSRPLVVTSSLAAIALGGLLIALPPAYSGKGKGNSSSSASGGTIGGAIRFTKAAPVRKAIDTSSDVGCKAKAIEEEVVVTKGKLRDVHVRIKSGTAGKHAPPKSPIAVVQDGCVYRPHVVGAMVGQAVAIANNDPMMHNVHAYIGGETWFNRSQPAGAPDIVETDTGEAGEVFMLKCNVHPWMHNYIPITDHPYFDVSATDGSFEIKHVPPGKYTLEAWHPKFGLKSKSIQVSATKRTKVSFRFP